MISVLGSLAEAVIRCMMVVAGYVTNSSTFPQPLNEEEEARYLARLQQGDDEARAVLIERNLRLVAHIVKKFDNTGEETDDLISIGTAGVHKLQHSGADSGYYYPVIKDGTSRMALTRIIRISSPQRHTTARLFCFPFAGGGISAYRPWVGGLPAHVEICAVQPPGREGNLMDRPYTDLHSLVADIRSGLDGRLDMPFMFFGHSMGALVSFELTRLLREHGDPLPRHLFLSAHAAPDIVRRSRAINPLSDEALIAEMRLLGGTPPEVLEHAELVQEMLPLIRADFTACLNYIYTEKAPLNLPMTIFGGYDDPTASPEDLQAWERHSSQPVGVQLLPGNHFYFLKQRSSFLRDLSHHMTVAMQGLEQPAPPSSGTP